ncbi:hypothetical protein HK102_001111, partial [Quaeritorhiza haematococci]
MFVKAECGKKKSDLSEYQVVSARNHEYRFQWTQRMAQEEDSKLIWLAAATTTMPSIQSLPTELLSQILSKASSADTASSVQLTRVCKKFLSTIYSTPLFWKHITFPCNCNCNRKRTKKQPVIDSAVDALITNLRTHETIDAIQVVDISNTSVTEAALFSIVTSFPNVE